MLVIYFLFIAISWVMGAVDKVKSFVEDQLNKDI